MKIINVEQGSAEWHAFRKEHIGGSDAPIIMGVSPYKTRWELWQEKVGISEPKAANSPMRRGSDLEKFVRADIEDRLFCRLIPHVFVHDTIEFLSYSSDGYDEYNDILIEIKCGTRAEHEGVRRGIIPDKYYPQLQHALLVTGMQEIYYVSHNSGETIYSIVERDEAYISKMLVEHRKFHYCMDMEEGPEIDEVHRKSLKKEYITIDNPVFKELAFNWQLLQVSKKNLADREDELKKAIIEYCENENTKGFGITVTKVIKSGYVDYSMIEELKSVDLEKYRKEKGEYWKIECK